MILPHPQRWLIGSLLTILGSGIIILAIRPVWGIDFVGGSLIEVEGSADAIQPVRRLLSEQFNLPATVQATQDDSIIIRTTTIDETQHQAILTALRAGDLASAQERRFETIGPTIGQELRRKSLTAVSLVVAAMIVYLAYTFRGMKGLITPWKFGVAAVYALIHDLLLVTALFVVFGRIWDTPIDVLFVTAQLAILGYSVNDTIVLFNRIKSEWFVTKSDSLLTVINTAMQATLGRSLNTSLTTLLVLLSLLIFGGSTIRWFIVALAAGTITGTYSSLFVAAPMLLYLSKPGKSQ
jgi:preprotein translocase subunit SecF